MSSNFKKCPNGHYYDTSLSACCPYCPSSNAAADSNKTHTYPDSFDDGKTRPYFEGAAQNGEPGTIVKGETPALPKTIVDGQPVAPAPEKPASSSNKTQFFGDEDKAEGEPTKRDYRKLVGWLVSYTIDDAGVDFKLYEGRNIIGRDGDCQIVIPDGGVTGRHAIILYRNGKYSITDQQSSNGTYVNGEDIELDPRYLKDGDVIKVGNTVLKFRTSF